MSRATNTSARPPTASSNWSASALSDMGNDLGSISDVVFDPATGALETVVLGDCEQPATSLLGAGSFAAIVRAPADQNSEASP